ncbi:MAG TPA: hypothetical protein VHO06_16420 [Polyangia bacterium]|nr:hypothetical protein [Polyangia bacterium]
MNSRRFSIWQKLVALAPLLLVAVYLPGEMMLRCRIDGRLRPMCCCSHDDQNQDPGPVAKAQDCCDQEMTGSNRPVVEAAANDGLDVHWVTAAVVPVVPLALGLGSLDRPVRIWRAQGPPPDGPPLILLKHAFLI